MAAELKAQADNLFKEQQFGKAANLYSKCIEIEASSVLYSNRAACWLKLKRFQKALEDCDVCLKSNPLFVKALYRKACALYELHRNDEALTILHEARQLEPKAKELLDLSKKIIGEKSPVMSAAAKITSDDYLQASQAAPSSASVAAEAGIPTPAPITSQAIESADFSEEKCTEFALRTIRDVELQLAAGEPIKTMCFVLIDDIDKPNGIGMERAWDTPELLSNCTGFVRQYLDENKAQAAVIQVDMANIAYPQVWKVPRWPHGEKGCFIHMESKTQRKVWFIPVGKTGQPRSLVELKADDYPLIAPLFVRLNRA